MLALCVVTAVAHPSKIPTVVKDVYATTTDQLPVKLDLKGLVEKYGDKYSVNKEHLYRVIMCESMGSSTIQSGYLYKGKPEKSYGLSQINTDFHPEVSYEQATNANFSVEFMAKGFAEGKQNEWTCWRSIYGEVTQKHPFRVFCV